LQVLTLQRGHYDVVLSDRNIFRYFTLRLKREGKIALAPVEEHEFVTLNRNDYRPVFRDPTVRDDFNAGLKHIKESGQFQAIYDKYVKV
jgi:polar amino acid transport system substrate-binding protein